VTRVVEVDDDDIIHDPRVLLSNYRLELVGEEQARLLRSSEASS
jgi:hypothetical protein